MFAAPVDPARRVDRVSAAEAGDERLFLADRVALVGAETLDANRKRRRPLKFENRFEVRDRKRTTPWTLAAVMAQAGEQ